MSTHLNDGCMRLQGRWRGTVQCTGSVLRRPPSVGAQTTHPYRWDACMWHRLAAFLRVQMSPCAHLSHAGSMQPQGCRPENCAVHRQHDALHGSPSASPTGALCQHAGKVCSWVHLGAEESRQPVPPAYVRHTWVSGEHQHWQAPPGAASA